MADWYELNKGQFLNSGHMAAISDNFYFISDFFINAGFQISGIKDVGVTMEISLAEIQQKFNNVEYNIQLLEEVSKKYFNKPNPYFKKYTWEMHPSNIKKEVYRWIDWLNEIKSYIDNTSLNSLAQEV